MKTKQAATNLRHARGLRFVFIVLTLVFVLVCGTRPSRAQPPSWTENDAYQAYTGCYDYFYNGPNTDSQYSDPTGNGSTYSVFAANKGGASWNTFWYEAEEIELAEDAY